LIGKDQTRDENRYGETDSAERTYAEDL